MKQELITKKKKLPEGWKIALLLDVVDVEKGTEPGSSSYSNTNGTPFLRIGEVSGKSKSVIFTTSEKIKLVNENDILMTFDGSPGLVCRGLKGAISSGIRKISSNDERVLLNDYLFWILQTRIVQKIVEKYTKGAILKHAGSSINNIKIILPPLQIQQKIVTKLDRQMAQIEMMKKEAEKAMESLKIMFGSYLLKIFDQGFPTKKLGDLINKIQNGVYKPAQFRTKGKKMVRMYNIENDSIVLNDNNLQEIELSDDEKTKYILDKDDILLSRVNSAELVGKCGIVKDKLVGYAFENMIIRIKVNQNRIIPDYLAFFLISQKGKKEIRGITRHAINQSSINNTDVKKLNIPLTNDLNEQLEIVHYLNQKYGVINSLQNHFKKRIESITHLTSSILNEVFGQYEIPEEA
jgi:type I restriction enzyme S subunit